MSWIFCVEILLHWWDLFGVFKFLRCSVEDFRQSGTISSWRPPGSVPSLVTCLSSLPKLRKGLKTTRRLKDQRTAAAQSCSVFSLSHRCCVNRRTSLFFFVFICSSEGSALWLLQEKTKLQVIFFFFFTSYKFLELILLMWNFLMQQFLSMSIFDLGIYFILTPQCCKVLVELSALFFFFLIV